MKPRFSRTPHSSYLATIAVAVGAISSCASAGDRSPNGHEWYNKASVHAVEMLQRYEKVDSKKARRKLERETRRSARELHDVIDAMKEETDGLASDPDQASRMRMMQKHMYLSTWSMCHRQKRLRGRTCRRSFSTTSDHVWTMMNQVPADYDAIEYPSDADAILAAAILNGTIHALNQHDETNDAARGHVFDQVQRILDENGVCSNPSPPVPSAGDGGVDGKASRPLEQIDASSNARRERCLLYRRLDALHGVPRDYGAKDLDALLSRCKTLLQAQGTVTVDRDDLIFGRAVALCEEALANRCGTHYDEWRTAVTSLGESAPPRQCLLQPPRAPASPEAGT